MSILKQTVFSLIAAVCFVATVNAQCSESGGFKYTRTDHGPTYIPAYRNFESRYGAHGNYGAYLHGAADVVRSRAYANLRNAEAWTQSEVARKMNMENSVLALQTRLERRRINRESRFGHLFAHGVQRKAQQAAHIHVSLTDEIRRPDNGLAEHELNPMSGVLNWPLLMRSSYFDRARKRVDDAFALRNATGTIDPNEYLPLRDWIVRIQAELTKNVKKIPSDDFAQSQDFLRRVLVEIRKDLPNANSIDTLVLN